jgi:uncharacterized C2H2 Zn-finger protein
VQADGLGLQYASARLRADAEVAGAAVRQTSYALQYAAEALQANPDWLARAESDFESGMRGMLTRSATPKQLDELDAGGCAHGDLEDEHASEHGGVLIEELEEGEAGEDEDGEEVILACPRCAKRIRGPARIDLLECPFCDARFERKDAQTLQLEKAKENAKEEEEVVVVKVGVGSAVEVVGLVGAAQHNGRRGAVVGRVAANGRYRVRLQPRDGDAEERALAPPRGSDLELLYRVELWTCYGLVMANPYGAFPRAGLRA